MWSLYDRLIDSVPEDVYIDEVTVGANWVLVRAGNLLGTAMYVPADSIPPTHPGDWTELSLKAAAEKLKSWNLGEASLGAAALNAYCNNRLQVFQAVKTHSNAGLCCRDNAFRTHLEAVRGRKVAVIGHFPNLEPFAEAAQLTILERNPLPGDYPDSACEYLLPLQDFVFITGSALINKTLPRLLALSQNAYTVLVGPTTPLSPILFEFGADELDGMLLEDPFETRRIVLTEGFAPALAEFGEFMGIQKR